MEVDSYKVASILHDVEDDLVVITLEEEEIEPTILGVPVDEVVKVLENPEVTVQVRCVFEDDDDLTSESALIISSWIGVPDGTISSSPPGEEDDSVRVSECARI